MSDFFVGIDAGGTHCRASLYDINGTVLGTGAAGAANVHSDFSGAIQQIEYAIANAIVNSGLTIENSHLVIGAGCAGGQTSQAKVRLSEWQHPYRHFFMTSDLHASCLAANAGKDCIVIITGTGSSIAHYKNDCVTQFGGHGFIHGDDASGAWLGLKAVQFVLKSVDHVVTDKVFCSQIFDLVPRDSNNSKNSGDISNLNNSSHINADEILHFFQHKTAADYAVLAPVIADLKVAGNQTAISLIDQGLDYLYSVLAANHLLGTSDIFMTGGLAPVYRDALALKTQQAIDIMQQPAQNGAFLFAQSQYININSKPTSTKST